MMASSPASSAVGRHWTEVETPALLVDLDIARRNVEKMAIRAANMPVLVRPHFKAHKSIALARLQIESGAVGMTVATVAEALVLIDAGIDDILLANQLAQQSQLEALVQAATGARIRVLVDDVDNLRALAATGCRAGAELGVMVEVDAGMGRCGVRSNDHAREIARLACRLDGVRFDGVSAYEGHCTGIRDPGERVASTMEALDVVCSFVDAVRGEGIDVPTVSAGGTSTYYITGADPRLTEIQPGAYALMDRSRQRLLADFEIALTVVGTVISRHGDRGILDCGLKAVNSKQQLPALAGNMGEVLFVDEEHLRFDCRGADPEVGDHLQVLPGYGPLTINLYDRFHVLSAGFIVDEWPVAARR